MLRSLSATMCARFRGGGDQGDGEEEEERLAQPKPSKPSKHVHEHIERFYGPLQTFAINERRQLTYRVFGRPLKEATKVILYHHGTPSCHLEGAIIAEAAAERDVAVVAPDRPGIGGSTYKRSLTLASFAADCDKLLDRLGVGKVIVVGNSGGGPYAVAFAVCHPARVEALGLIAALGPTDWRKKAHRDNLRSMEGFDRFQMSAARGPNAFLWGTPVLWLAHRTMRYMADSKPDLLLEYAPKGMSEVDGEMMRTDQRVKDNFAAVLQHAYSGSGARGVGRDVKVLGRKWGVDPCSVNCRTLIFHGTEDKSVPLAHAHYYAQQIRDHKLYILDGEGHVTLPVRHAVLIVSSLLAAASGVTPALPADAPVLSAAEQESVLRRASFRLEEEAAQALEEGEAEPSEASSDAGNSSSGVAEVTSEEGSHRPSLKSVAERKVAAEGRGAGAQRVEGGVSAAGPPAL